MDNDRTGSGDHRLRQDEGAGRARRVVDPSDAVTGMSVLFGAAGAVIGVVAALVVAPLGWATIVYCLLAAFAYGSAGIVIGGMIGAIFAVLRGVTTRSRNP